MEHWYWIGYHDGREYYAREAELIEEDQLYVYATNLLRERSIESDDDIYAFLKGFDAGFWGY